MQNKEAAEAIQKMDAAAKEARKELDPKAINAAADPVKEVANWMKRWYSKAGYKRLSKALIELAD
jgi:uncharacterized membrane protein YccC